MCLTSRARLLLGAALAVLLLVAAAGPALAVPRLAGTNRVETAAAAALDGWDRARTVVVVRSDSPADALPGTALAARFDAPLLMTDRDGLAGPTRRAVRKLKARRAVVVGGKAVLSGRVVRDLRDAGVDKVSRIAGTDRAGTAARAALRVADGETVDTVMLVGAWPDALAAAAVSARKVADGRPWPVLHSLRNRPGRPTTAALRELDPRRVVLVGGTHVLSGKLASRLRDQGYRVERASGDDRYETAVSAAKLDPAGAPTGKVVAVTGATFADAVAAGAWSARSDAEVAVVPPSGMRKRTSRWLRSREGAALTVFGGRSALPDGQVARVDALLSGRRDRVVADTDAGPRPPVAQAGGVTLLQPSRDTVGAGFHQASSHASLSMAEAPGANVMVMPSRGRGTGRTTAMDFVVERGTPVLAPVSGTVVDARTYALYGSTPDQIAVIRTSSGRHVRMLHLDGLRVHVGQQVTAGETPVAWKARLLPFSSQIDAWTGRRPHVHLEVR